MLDENVIVSWRRQRPALTWKGTAVRVIGTKVDALRFSACEVDEMLLTDRPGGEIDALVPSPAGGPARPTGTNLLSLGGEHPK
jgi:hypothetical protein